MSRHPVIRRLCPYLCKHPVSASCLGVGKVICECHHKLQVWIIPAHGKGVMRRALYGSRKLFALGRTTTFQMVDSCTHATLQRRVVLTAFAVRTIYRCTTEVRHHRISHRLSLDRYSWVSSMEVMALLLKSAPSSGICTNTQTT